MTTRVHILIRFYNVHSMSSMLNGRRNKNNKRSNNNKKISMLNY